MHRARTYAVGIVLACVLGGCGGGAQTHDVVVYTAGARSITDHPGGVGTTVAGISVPVSVDFGDQITEVLVKPGDVVHRGQPLISLDPTPFKAQVASLHTKQQLIQGEIQNTQNRIAISQAKGDNSQITALTAQIASYQGQYVILQQQIDIANGRNTQLLAPIDGAIGEVKVQPNTAAAPGQILMTVVDNAQIQVTASLPISDRPFVDVGSAADIHVTPSPGSTASTPVLTGKVAAIAPGASGAGAFFTATVVAANTAAHTVLPGLQAYVRVGLTRTAPVVVPQLAVMNLDSDPIVYVVDSGGIAHPRSVQTGLSDGSYVEILNGVKAGEQCVIVGSQLLSDGSRVRITRTLGG
jgi:RND family efflux transporter MFP subunit